MNYSDDSRIDGFCRELGLILRRITGRNPDSLPDDLPRKSGPLDQPQYPDSEIEAENGGNDGLAGK